MGKIERMISTLRIEGHTRSELEELFPAVVSCSKMVVKDCEGAVIWEVEEPIDETKEIVKILHHIVGSFTYTIESSEERTSCCVKIQGRTCSVYDKSEKDKISEIRVLTYTSDPDKHYENLQEIKNALIARGVFIKDAQCEVYTHTRC